MLFLDEHGKREGTFNVSMINTRLCTEFPQSPVWFPCGQFIFSHIVGAILCGSEELICCRLSPLVKLKLWLLSLNPIFSWIWLFFYFVWSLSSFHRNQIFHRGSAVSPIVTAGDRNTSTLVLGVLISKSEFSCFVRNILFLPEICQQYLAWFSPNWIRIPSLS